MYCEFYGFSEKPFDVTPDPKFLFLSPSHREVLASLIYGIRERRGFISVVGEVGTGKTTLLNTLLDRLDDKTKVANIFNTDASFRQILLMLLMDLCLAESDEKIKKIKALHRLNEFAIRQMAQGGNVVIIVDEAQNLDQRSMEDLRVLSNLETRKHKLIQIILSGQPELDQKLAQPELRQLSQRISLKRYIKPLTEAEMYDYIEHRLSIVGSHSSKLFEGKSKELIWEYSQGIPRKINILCDNIFLIGFGVRKKKIDISIVKEAIRDLDGPYLEESVIDNVKDESLPSLSIERTTGRRFAVGASLLLAAFCGSAIGILFGYSLQNFGAKGVEQPLVLRRSAETNLKSGEQSRPTALPESPRDGGLPGRNQQRNDVARVKDKEIPKDQTISYEETEPPETQEKQDQGNSSRLEALDEKKDSTGVSSKRVVIVRAGDSLSGIIKRYYGKYDESMLRKVLKRNPYIRNPEFIMAGQILTMPQDTD